MTLTYFCMHALQRSKKRINIRYKRARYHSIALNQLSQAPKWTQVMSPITPLDRHAAC